MNIIDIFINSLLLIFSFDKELWKIILLSLYVSFIALIIGTFFGLLLGYLLAIKKFFLKNFLLVFINAMMGIPPVVVGLIVYFLFANQGPFGVFEILYTPTAMIIAQSIIVFPIISSFSHEIFLQSWKNYQDQFRSLNMPFFGIVKTLFSQSYFLIITALLSAFGRAISEVGAVMIVGGNIEEYTRVMTTAISLETRMGNLDYAMALGIVLITLTMTIYSIVYLLNLKRR